MLDITLSLLDIRGANIRCDGYQVEGSIYTSATSMMLFKALRKRIENMVAQFDLNIATTDPLIAGAQADEKKRQQSQIELIASENIVSRAVLDALGHEMTNKTLEGYPGARFHGGGQYVDVVEQAAIDRAKELFGAAYVNVQPHSGSQIPP